MNDVASGSDDPWGAPQEIGSNEPRNPYAHWWLQHGRSTCGAEPCFLALRGPDLRNAGLFLVGAEPGEHGRWVAKDGPSGEVAAIPEDHRLTPVRVPGALLNHECLEGARLYAPNRRLSANAAILGIIDDGIAFANERFRRHLDGGGMETRFDHLWLQGVPDRCPQDGAKGQALGLELSAREIDGTEEADGIDGLLTRYRRGAGTVDEEALYREVGMIDFSSDEVQSAAVAASHGTGVLDRAAGADPRGGDGRDVAVIGVALPGRITRDTSGTFLDLFLMTGIRRILRRAEYLRSLKVHGEVPVVINISVALTAGPKDGTGLVERYIAEEMARANRIRPGLVRVVMPSGNHRLWRGHCRFNREQVEAGADVIWRVQPDDRTPSFVEIWFQRQNARPVAPTVRLALSEPGRGEGDLPKPPRPPFGSFVEFTRRGASALAYYSWHPADPRMPEGPGRQRIVLVVPPSAAERPRDLWGPSGDWRLGLRLLEGAEPLAADLHVQRDDSLPGFHGGGRQSYFPDAAYREFDERGRLIEGPEDEAGPVTRRGTINALCSGEGVIAVSGYRAADRRLVPYSGLGPDDNVKPDALAVSECAPAHRGVLTAGTFSGGVAVIAGTSIAAPRVARHLLDRQFGPRSRDGVRRRPLHGIPVLDDDEDREIARLDASHRAPSAGGPASAA